MSLGDLADGGLGSSFRGDIIGHEGKAHPVTGLEFRLNPDPLCSTDDLVTLADIAQFATGRSGSCLFLPDDDHAVHALVTDLGPVAVEADECAMIGSRVEVVRDNRVERRWSEYGITDVGLVAAQFNELFEGLDQNLAARGNHAQPEL